MLETILAFFTGTLAGKATLASLGVYLLGLFAGSGIYKTARKAWGVLCEKAGAALSAFGSTKLGAALWQPSENVFLDFLAHGVEQFAVGLRKDNPEKMKDQLERLEAVGSRTRADALAAKIGRMEAEMQPMTDANDIAMAGRVIRIVDDSARQKLGEG